MDGSERGVPVGRRSRRVLVAGASGFLGSHLVRGLSGKGHVLHGLVRTGSNVSRLEGWIPANGSDRLLPTDYTLGSLKDAVRRAEPDVVINSVGYGLDPGQRDLDVGFQINVRMALDIAEAAASAGADAIHIGSAFEYAPSDAPLGEHAELRPESFYGVTKASASLLLWLKAREVSTRVLIVRPFGIYGPDEAASKLFPAVIAACRQGRPLDLSNGGKVRDYTYIDDVIDAFDAIVSSHDDWPETVNIGSGRPLRLRYVVEQIGAFLGADPRLFRWNQQPARAGDPFHLVCDPALMCRLFGWRAQTGFHAGLQRTLAALGTEERS